MSDALAQTVSEIERHLAPQGWDQPRRLYALADTADLVAREPALAQRLGLGSGGASGVVRPLTPVEQEGLPEPPDGSTELGEVLSVLAWPAEVAGCALALEAEVGDRRVRLVAGALRDGTTAGLLRARPLPGQQEPGPLIDDPDLLPALCAALLASLHDLPHSGPAG